MDIKVLIRRTIRVVYDTVMLNVSMAMAICLHNLTFLVRQFEGEFTFDFYLRQINSDFAIWNRYLAPYIVGSLLIFAVCRFYNTWRFRRFRDRVFFIFLGVLLSNVYLLLLMYFRIEQTYFPRGVTILFLLGSMLTIGLPRVFRPLLSRLSTYLNGPDTRGDYVRNVLVIGGGGYIGSVLCEHLIECGYNVRVLDVLLFGEKPLAALKEHRNFEFIRGDFRNIADMAPCLQGMDAVIHLGGLVGDPACAVKEDLTVDINLAATHMLMELCKAQQIRRFVFASTCSVYGVSEDILTERSSLNPVSLYARTKIDSENILLDAASPVFQPTILRLATVFGPSRRPRFDLVVNAFVAQAVQKGECEVYGGNQWRPFVHVYDVARAFERVLSTNMRRVGSQIFNVGDDRLNFTITAVAESVQSIVQNVSIRQRGDLVDPRNYRVSFEKIKNALSFKCEKSLDDGIREVCALVKEMPGMDLSREAFNNFQHTKRMVAEGEPTSVNRLHKADRMGTGVVRADSALVSPPR